MELAKDVSALANADGGFILIGVTTEIEPTSNGEVIRRISCFAPSLLNPNQYRNVISEWVIPSIDGLVFQLNPQITNPSEALVSIFVPHSATNRKPFIVSKIVSETDRIVGSYVGYFERTRDIVPPMKPAELRERLKDGLRFAELNSRLDNIEELVAKATVPPNPVQPIIQEQELRPRMIQARREVGYPRGPSFSLLAWPLQATQFPDLFESHDAPVVRLLEHPPRIREAGFDLSTNQMSMIIEASRRRCLAPNRRLLEIWRDGVLICAMPGEDHHLCWGMHSDATTGWRINNLALTETVFLFCEWTLQVFGYAVPPPTAFMVRVMLADMTASGSPPFRLSSYRPNFMNIGEGDRPSPVGQTGVTAEIAVTRVGAQAGAIAYKLLADIFNWFGFNASEMPYVNRESQPPVIHLSGLP